MREQFEVTGQRIDETREHLLRVEADMAVVIEQLDRERYTVFKPLLRRAYRLGAAVAMRLPGPVRRLLQRLKRRLLPRSVALRVTAGRPLPATDADAETVPDLGQHLRSATTYCLPGDRLAFPVPASAASRQAAGGAGAPSLLSFH